MYYRYYVGSLNRYYVSLGRCITIKMTNIDFPLDQRLELVLSGIKGLTCYFSSLIYVRITTVTIVMISFSWNEYKCQQ